MISILREKIHIFARIVQSQLVLSTCVQYLLGSKAHAEAGQVAVGEGEEDHEDDVPGVVGEQHGQVETWHHVAQHEERHEDDTQRHEDRKPDAVLTWLQRDTVTFKTGNNNNSVTLLISHTLWKQWVKHVRRCTDHPKCFGALKKKLKNVKSFVVLFVCLVLWWKGCLKTMTAKKNQKQSWSQKEARRKPPD